MAKVHEKQPPLLTHADELVEKLRAMVPRAVKDGDETAVHQARVATRRLKAALDVFEPVSTRTHRKEFGKILKKLRQSLGPVRDMDVMIGHLKELKTTRTRLPTDWARSRMTERQEKLHQSAAQNIDVAKVMAKLGAWWGVKQEWLEAADGLDSLIADSLHLQLDRFIEHADAIAGRTGSKAPAELLDPHQLRIAGKALRYTLEMAIAGGHKLPAAVTRAFKKMQDALGLWHDYVVLADHLMKLSLKASLGHHDADLQIGVLDLARVTVGKSKKQLEVFSKLWNARGEELSATIRRAFPLTQIISIPQMDHDPSGSGAPADNSAPVVQDAPSAASAKDARSWNAACK